MRRRLGALLGGLGWFLPAAALAQPAVPTPAWQPVPVAVYPEPRELSFELQLTDTRQPVALCEGACTAWLPRGRYRLVAHETLATRGGGRTIVIDGPSRVQLSARSNAQFQTGLTLGIVGSALLFVSSVVLLTTLDSRESEDVTLMSLAGMLTGAALTPIGWVMFGKSLRPKTEIQPLAF